MPRVYTKTANRGAKKTKTCTKCHGPIEPKQRYYQWCPRAARSGSGYNRYRHVSCGSPTQSELYPFNKMAPLWDAQAQADADLSQITVEGDDFASAVEAAKEAIQVVADSARDIGAEYGESADNIESGFGHETYQSQELREKADALESWADELEGWDAPEDEPDLDGVEDDERDDAIDQWLSDMTSAASEALNEVPV